tara:strand:+ start:19 stop:459 length:441 start_codon:yes stop_codon:yes gene_type:complete
MASLSTAIDNSSVMNTSEDTTANAGADAAAAANAISSDNTCESECGCCTDNDFANSIKHHPLTIVSECPNESDDGKSQFIRLVWRQIQHADFTDVSSFEGWFRDSLIPNIASDFGGNKKMGMMMITMTFGSIDPQFMLWVLTKFTR